MSSKVQQQVQAILDAGQLDAPSDQQVGDMLSDEEEGDSDNGGRGESLGAVKIPHGEKRGREDPSEESEDEEGEDESSHGSVSDHHVPGGEKNVLELQK